MQELKKRIGSTLKTVLIKLFGDSTKSYGSSNWFNHGSVPKQRLFRALFRIHRPIGVIKLDIIADNREFESL